MTTPSWSTMLMLTMASPWRVICSRGPAMPLRHGTGMTYNFDGGGEFRDGRCADTSASI